MTESTTRPSFGGASPFKVDTSESGMAGVTLMNNQIGVVVAEVMDRHENVTVTHLPAMIRVDCKGRMDFVYDEISEALGEEGGDPRLRGTLLASSDAHRVRYRLIALHAERPAA